MVERIIDNISDNTRNVRTSVQRNGNSNDGMASPESLYTSWESMPVRFVPSYVNLFGEKSFRRAMMMSGWSPLQWKQHKHKPVRKSGLGSFCCYHWAVHLSRTSIDDSRHEIDLSSLIEQLWRFIFSVTIRYIAKGNRSDRTKLHGIQREWYRIKSSRRKSSLPLRVCKLHRKEYRSNATKLQFTRR